MVRFDARCEHFAFGIDDDGANRDFTEAAPLRGPFEIAFCIQFVIHFELIVSMSLAAIAKILASHAPKMLNIKCKWYFSLRESTVNSAMNDEVRSGDPAWRHRHSHYECAAVVPRLCRGSSQAYVRSRGQRPVTIPQKLLPAEFNMAMVHFYRGEMQRSNVWRGRLDATTNWAVITAGATLSFVFSSPDNPHFAIPINSILVSIFLFMEARRYRYYEVWANRVRVLETGYFAPMLSHRTIPPDKEWAEHISADLISPHFTISEWEAVGRRLRANYLWIFILLALSWTLKIYIHPSPIPVTTEADSKLFWDVVFQTGDRSALLRAGL